MNNLEQFKKDRFLYCLVSVIFRRKWLILFLFSFVMGMVVFGTWLMTPQWEATTYILVESNPKAEISPFPSAVAPGLSTTPMVQAMNLVYLLTGKNMAYEVVKSFELDKRLYRRTYDPKTLREKIKAFIAINFIIRPIDYLMEMGVLEFKQRDWVDKAAEDFREGLRSWINIEVEEGTQVINLMIRGETPALAMDVANFMAHRLREKTAQFVNKEINMVHAAHQKDLLEIEEKLNKAQAALRKYKEESKVTFLDAETQVKITKREDLKKTFFNVQKELEILAVQKKQLNQDKEGEETLLTSETISSDPIIQALKSTLHTKETNLASLIKEKKDIHPEVIGLKTEIAQMRENLKKEITNVIRTLTARFLSISQELSEINKEILDVPEHETNLAHLNLQVDTYQKLYQSLKSQEEELKTIANSPVGEISLKILDEAYVSPVQSADWPLWILNIPVGLFLATVVALGFPFILNYWNDQFLGSKDVQDAGIPVIGSIPYSR